VITRHTALRVGLASLFTVSGSAHFLVPSSFAAIVPPFLGPSFPWVYASGVAELACAAGLFSRPPRVRLRAAQASAVLLVAVFPANVYMAVEAFRDAHSALYRAATLVRLPIQVPLVVAALAVARQAGSSRPWASTAGTSKVL